MDILGSVHDRGFLLVVIRKSLPCKSSKKLSRIVSPYFDLNKPFVVKM